MTGHGIDTIRGVLLTALDNQTLAGLTHLVLTLTQCCDPLSLTSPSAAAACIDGAFIVVPVNMRTVAGTTPQAVNGTVQRKWEVTYSVQWSFNESGCVGEKLSVDLLKAIDAVIRLANAALEPQSGTNYNVVSTSAVKPTRVGNILIYEVQYVCKFDFT